MNNRFPSHYYSRPAPTDLRSQEDVKRQKLMEEEQRKEMAKQQQQAMRAQQQHALLTKYLQVDRSLSKTSPTYTGHEVSNCKIRMMPHQLAMAYRLKEAETFVTQAQLTKNMYMTDEPGSGKTFAILYYLAVCKQQQTQRRTVATMIVVPPALVEQWMEAIEQFGGGLKSIRLTEYAKIQQLQFSTHHLQSNDIALTSTDVFPNIRDNLNAKDLGLHRVIIDEVDGVVDFQQIDCVPLNRPDMRLTATALNDYTNPATASNQRKQSAVPHVPANMIIRVSASMNVPAEQERQFPVTICKCQPQFIEESIHLEPPEFHVIRCPDIHIQSILQHFLEPHEIKAVHALDFKTAIRKYRTMSGLNNAQSVTDSVGVLKCLEGYYRNNLQAHRRILQTYITNFPYLEEFEAGYGKDFTSLTVPKSDGSNQSMINPKHTSRWTTLFNDLEQFVVMQICEEYDDKHEVIKDCLERNKTLRCCFNQSGFCGGRCLTQLKDTVSYYQMPCCKLNICMPCVDLIDEDAATTTTATATTICPACDKTTESKNLRVMTNPQGAFASRSSSENTKSTPDDESGGEQLDKIDALLSIFLQAKDESLAASRVTDNNRTVNPTNDDNNTQTIRPLKIILATEFSQVFTGLEGILKASGLEAAYLEAGSPEKTNEVVRRFMDPKSNLAIVFCQITTVGRGLNLPIATHVINFQRLEDKIRLQTIGRAQRLGRTGRLQVYDILHEGE